jgi:chromate reductase
VLNTPSVMIGQAGAKFDEQGRLTDQPTREIIAQMLVAFAEWTRRHRR